MKRWIYHRETNATGVELQTLGEDGWELVSVVSTKSDELEQFLYFYFKKELTE
jgi:hypothetical protein